jgi:carbonic anhydrase
MATPVSPADAPAPEPAVAAAGAVPPRWRARLPRLALPRLPAGLRLPSKRVMVLAAAGLVGLAGVAAAAAAFWPAEPEWPRTPVHKPKKIKRVADAASAAASAASAVTAAAPPASAASAVAIAASAASGPESSMDRLQRRLAETLGGNGSLEAGAGELKLTSRRPTATAPARREASAAAASVAASSHPPHEPPVSRMSRDPAAVPHWSYEGVSGPDAWSRLAPGFAKCASGQRQSPIDIQDGFRVQLDPVRFDYRPSAFRVVDNGHTVQVDVAAGNAIEVMGRRYELRQFHFHRPSEERIAGRQFDMVAHLVHQDAEGRQAVVAVLLEHGAAQPVVQAVWNNLPLEKGEEQAASAPLDLQQLLPRERGYYTYMGSLTTPPCTEGVLWLVMKQPVAVSPEQIALFARLYPMNARPVQPSAGRIVKESD